MPDTPSDIRVGEPPHAQAEVPPGEVIGPEANPQVVDEVVPAPPAPPVNPVALGSPDSNNSAKGGKNRKGRKGRKGARKGQNPNTCRNRNLTYAPHPKSLISFSAE